MATETIAGAAPQKTARIRRVQTITLALLFIAGIVNFLDRSSLSVAGEAIRGELGLSATEFGVLLSAFSLSYGLSPPGSCSTASAPGSCWGPGLWSGRRCRP